MQTFSKNEILWMQDAIKLATEYYNACSKQGAGLEVSLAALRSEQLAVISEKLGNALGAGNKRMEIKY